MQNSFLLFGESSLLGMNYTFLVGEKHTHMYVSRLNTQSMMAPAHPRRRPSLEVVLVRGSLRYKPSAPRPTRLEPSSWCMRIAVWIHSHLVRVLCGVGVGVGVRVRVRVRVMGPVRVRVRVRVRSRVRSRGRIRAWGRVAQHEASSPSMLGLGLRLRLRLRLRLGSHSMEASSSSIW